MARVITKAHVHASSSATMADLSGGARQGSPRDQRSKHSNNARAVGTAAAPARRFPAQHEGRPHTAATRWQTLRFSPRHEDRASTDEWGNGSSPRWPRAEVQALVKKGEVGGQSRRRRQCYGSRKQRRWLRRGTWLHGVQELHGRPPVLEVVPASLPRTAPWVSSPPPLSFSSGVQ
jgi:hypothetical protein